MCTERVMYVNRKVIPTNNTTTDYYVLTLLKKKEREWRKANFLVSSSSQYQGTVKSFAQDLGLVLSDDLKESNMTQLPAAIKEECSISVVHSVSNSQ
ncbi:hypothetical protein H5410_006019, partial [Solanum commersonii]